MTASDGHSVGDQIMLVAIKQEIDKSRQRQIAVEESDTPARPVIKRIFAWSGSAEPERSVSFRGVKTRVAYFSLYEELGDFSQPREVTTGRPVPNKDRSARTSQCTVATTRTACALFSARTAGRACWTTLAAPNRAGRGVATVRGRGPSLAQSQGLTRRGGCGQPRVAW